MTQHEQELVRKAKRDEREACARMCDDAAYAAWLRPDEARMFREVASRIRQRRDP